MGAPYTMIGQTCAGTIKEFTNPVNEFKIGCSATGACAQTDFIFNYDANYYGERINQIVFSETYAGYMSTITLDNQSPYSLYIDVIKCSAVGACQDMQIRTIGACQGCQVEICKREANTNTGEIEVVCGPKKA